LNTVNEPLAGEIKPSFVYEGQEYYNRSDAAKYVGMSVAGLRQRIERIERENNIIFPFTTFPGAIDAKNRNSGVYIHSKILNLLRKPVLVGKTHEWLEKLKETIKEVQPE
jgi:hypothetical protein